MRHTPFLRCLQGTTENDGNGYFDNLSSRPSYATPAEADIMAPATTASLPTAGAIESASQFWAKEALADWGYL
jgi:hypothetical protein